MTKTIIDRLLPGRRVRRGEQFDRKHSVETSQAVSREGLTGMSAELRDHAGDYVPTNPVLFRQIVRKSGVDPKNYTFVDLGCGKGRTLVAASEYPFKAILGVEADIDLYETAKRNLDSMGNAADRADVVHCDACTVELPEGNLFIFMYSPFRGPIFEQMARRLAEIADEPGRAMIIAYSRDWEADALERTGRFRRARMRRRQFWAPSTVSFFFNAEADRMRRNHR